METREAGNKMTLKLKVIENTLPLSVNCFTEIHIFYTFQNSLTPHLRRYAVAGVEKF